MVQSSQFRLRKGGGTGGGGKRKGEGEHVWILFLEAWDRISSSSMEKYLVQSTFDVVYVVVKSAVSTKQFHCIDSFTRKCFSTDNSRSPFLPKIPLSGPARMNLSFTKTGRI